MNAREALGVRYLGPYKTEADAQASAFRWAQICTGGAKVVLEFGKWWVYRMGSY